MVKYLFAIIILAISTNLVAQDEIYLSNGNTIKAEVLKISEELIQFKKEENKDGPIYEKSLKNIDSIRYKNGFLEVFTDYLTSNYDLVETDTIIYSLFDSTCVDEIIIDGIKFFIVNSGGLLKTYNLVADFTGYKKTSVQSVPGDVSFVFEMQKKTFTMYATASGNSFIIPFRLESSGSYRRFEKIVNCRLMQVRFSTITLYIDISQVYSDAFNNMFRKYLR